MKLNQAAFKQAKSLIDDGKVVKDSDWSEKQPSSDDENKFLDDKDWDTYGKWFLALDTDENDDTKGHFNFPYGDFKKVHRSAVIAAKQRAGQYDYKDIEDAADELLEKIDGDSK
ncbi:hypothetical protein G4Y79_10025 [Phototrophicus methaneseepsis]|uniref:Uncharacterized protein n=1 Tax=Phototrophicus methaneseepsis TaxID=2710758 RepID=A0A7S8IFG0_9CHLR|nr:hypothetical protein [Phototrophicus methaneseepsis]QPC84690.1 hypothetical protein G4Y79_10025 [Phototrophicus methaneseepsis]